MPRYTSEHDLPHFADPGSLSMWGDPKPRYEGEYDSTIVPEPLPFNCESCGTPLEAEGRCMRCISDEIDAALAMATECEICGQNPATQRQGGYDRCPTDLGDLYLWTDYNVCAQCAQKRSAA